MGTRITNVDIRTRRITDTGQTVEHGETIEVDSDLAERLLEQTDVWARATTKAAKEAASEGDDV